MEPLEHTDRDARVPTVWIVVGIVAGAVLLYAVWRLLNWYIAPGDDPTQRKDLVQAFAVLVGGLVAAGTLLIGWRNLRHNQRTLLINQHNTQETLRNAQEVENRRAQGSSLQAYFEQMGDLLLDKKLREAQTGDEVRILAQAQTHTVLPTLNADRKRSIVVFLYKSMLIQDPDPIVGLVGADLREVDLSNAHLPGINVQGVNLQEADLGRANLRTASLSEAFLREAFLSYADLRGADLRGAFLWSAFLQGADLREADLREADLQGADLQGAFFRGANLQGADLGGALLTESDILGVEPLTQEQLEQASGDKNTKLPEGLERPKSWTQGEDKQADVNKQA
jgi:uncharacterized protein YjbI with pentapeptide repeats